MLQYTKKDSISPKENIWIQKKTVDIDTVDDGHTHEFIELVYVVDGHAQQSVDGKTFEVQKGDMFFIDYHQVHAYKAKAHGYSYIDILIDPQIIGKEFLNIDTVMEVFAMSVFREFDCSNFNSTQCVRFKGKKISEIESIIDRMLLEFDQKQTGYVSVLSGYLRVLFSLFLRALSEKEKQQDRDNEKYIKSILPEIVEYINIHCCEKISLNELANQCFYNPSYFSHAFKKYCGKSLSRYIKEKRISNAVELLEKTDYSVEAIARMVGYADKSSFYKVFREITGGLPTDFRE